ncbi:tRNA lysidine(34) synthetase TilS [Emticicia oligotrophica]|nr:tRNA lysidine(34) synthetase TilS [Emticicia oligotrophica]
MQNYVIALMLHAFLTYINEQKLFEVTDKVLLTVSGGKDSVVMFELFCRSKLNFAVAHCNFQLRGSESDQDQVFVEQLCRVNKVNFHTQTFDTKAFAKQKKISIEMAARTLRYEWFEQIREEFSYSYIATAHHLNDSIETVLLNLTKGTGIAGLRGILPKKELIIRPLLFASREAIDNFVQENKLQWREDSSNASNDYQRNLIRNEVVPLLKKINPNLDETFARNLERFQSIEADFRKNLSHFKAKVMRESNGVFYIKIANIKYWQSANYFIEELLKEFGFNYFQSKEIFASIDGISGKIFHSETHSLLKDREEFIIYPKLDAEIEKTLLEIQKEDILSGITISFEGNKLRFSLVKAEEFDGKFERNNAIGYFDFEKITFPLTMRRWKEGDSFIPFGMKGQKKISDFLIDKKISLHLKKNIFLLVSAGQIMWVVNYRTDERFRLQRSSKMILKAEII